MAIDLTGRIVRWAGQGIDDAWLTLGSANLNDHSFFNDSEMNVVTCAPDLARETRLRLWAEHLELSVDEVSGAPAEVIGSGARSRPISGPAINAANPVLIA